jgi:hypothetical protein
MDNSLRRWTFFPYSPFCLCGNITVFDVFIWDFVSIPAWNHLCQSDSGWWFSALGGSDTCNCYKTKYHPSNDTSSSLKFGNIYDMLLFYLEFDRLSAHDFWPLPAISAILRFHQDIQNKNPISNTGNRVLWSIHTLALLFKGWTQ